MSDTYYCLFLSLYISLSLALLIHPPKKTQPYPSYPQLQSALGEFDFLYHIEHGRSSKAAISPPTLQYTRHPPPVQSPPPPPAAVTTQVGTRSALSSQPQQRPHVLLSPDVYHRPVLSMPPVILMGGDGNHNGGNGGGGFVSLFGGGSPGSPIVEMPPSPAPSQIIFVEFPDEDEDYNKHDDDETDDIGVQLRNLSRGHTVNEVRTKKKNIKTTPPQSLLLYHFLRPPACSLQNYSTPLSLYFSLLRKHFVDPL